MSAETERAKIANQWVRENPGALCFVEGRPEIRFPGEAPMSDETERENLAEAERDSDLKFVGFKGRSCGDRNHVTDGRDSAWCLDCFEWCYVEGGRCRGCEAVPAKRAAEQFAQMRAERDEALGLLKKAVRMINDEDALTHSEWTREADAWLAQTEALVERTSQGGET